MSPNRLLATTTSSVSGAVIKRRRQRIDVIGRDLDVRVVRRDLGDDLVPEDRGVVERVRLGRAGRAVGRAPGRDRRRSGRSRSMPRRVKSEVWIATSSGAPAWKRPPSPAYSPSVFSRMHRMSTSAGPRSRSGPGIPRSRRAGRRFTYWSKPGPDRQQQAPQRDVVGDAREPDRAEVDGVGVAQAGRGRPPASSGRARGTTRTTTGSRPARWRSDRSPRRPARAPRRPSGMTSLPIPSPGDHGQPIGTHVVPPGRWRRVRRGCSDEAGQRW